MMKTTGMANGIIAIITGFGAVWAAAESSQEDRIEEIVVTASKRGAENVQEIPYNISAVTGQTLRQVAAANLADVAALVPGLTVIDQGPNNTIPIMRGLSTPVGTEQVSIYFDETPVTGDRGNSRSANLRVVDIERVEVLRGPQGTLYGNGSQGGTLRYILNKPRLDRFSGEVGLTLGARSRDGGMTRDVNGVINLPLAEGVFGIRAVAYSRAIDGYVDLPDLDIDGSDDEDTSGVRLIALWEIGERTSLQGSISQQKTDVDDRPQVVVESDSRPGVVMNLSEDDFTAINATLEHEFSWGRLTASVSDFDVEGRNEFDVSQFLPPPFHPFGGAVNQPGSEDLFSAEVRIASTLGGPWQYLMGGFYQERDSIFFSYLNFRDPNDGSEAAGFPNLFDTRADSRSDHLAIFGELSYAVSDRFEILGGFRYFEIERFQQRRITADAFDPNPILLPDLPPPTQSKYDGVVFRGHLSWDVTNDLLVYGTVSEGFREGGENSITLAGGGVIPPTYDPDIVRNHEIGIKSTFLDNQLTVNAAAYYMIWDDIQVPRRDPTERFVFVDNAGEASLIGVEIEMLWRPDRWPGFSARLSARLSEQELTEDEPSAAMGDPRAGRDGDRIPNTYPGEVSVVLERLFNLGRLDAFARVNASYQAQALTTFNRGAPGAREWGDFFLAGAQFGAGGENWDATLYATNLFDEREPLSWTVEVVPGLPDRIVTTRPREVGVALRYRF